MKYRILIILCLLLSSCPIVAKKYPFQYDYKELEKKALKGDIACQYYMGKTFAEGRLGKTPNAEISFSWFLKAASQGHSRSQWEVAKRYYTGNGVEKDEKEFIFWTKMCAYNEASDSETYLARLNLGKILGLGLFGVDKDIPKAIEILNKASSYNEDDYKKIYIIKYNLLGKLYQENASLQLFSPAEYQKAIEAYKQALYWAERDYYNQWKDYKEEALSGIILNILYYNTFADSNDYSEMINTLEKGVREKVPSSLYFLGEIYYFGGGFGLDEDKNKGWELLLSAASTHPKAGYIVANEYYSQKDYAKAIEYFKKFTQIKYNYATDESALSDAYRKLATMYRFGRGTVKNETEANNFLSKAAELGDADAEKIKEWLSVGMVK
ncbi:MAG: hypothetical protein K2G69_02730 [Muribaculaceae bacterium]|nr:hypothetical protein [Muribaculaceae bacterium]